MLGSCSKKEPIKNVLGVSWDADKEEVKEVMAKVRGAELLIDTISENGTGLSYRGGIINGFEVENIAFAFHEDSFIYAQVNYKYYSEFEANESFKLATEILTEDLGTPMYASAEAAKNDIPELSPDTRTFLKDLTGKEIEPFFLWSIGDDAQYIITCTMRRWVNSGPLYVHMAYINRATSQEFFKAMEKKHGASNGGNK